MDYGTGKTHTEQPDTLDRMLNRLCKWRAHFAGWQLGTRVKEDPESQAVRDHREVTILLRAEVNALIATLNQMHPKFLSRYQENLLAEAEELNRAYERKFPGVKATDDGLSYGPAAAEHMKNWRP